MSTLLVADLDSDAPKTAMVDTRARPTMRADDVCAVRRGLRIEFSRPNLPEIPKTAARGRPSALDSGRATTGASIPMPMKMATAPTPTSWMAGLPSPRVNTATPRTASTLPTVMRRRDDSCWSERKSANAATGGMRTARRAGLTADTTVTPMPTTSAATAVRGAKTSGPDGRVMPKPLSSSSRPRAASTPRPRPTSDATVPRMAASTSTDRNTCRRLAPTIRSRASSRVRWPTMIENVLKMVNPPTNSEMKANTSRAVEKKESAWLMSFDCSAATVWPVTTSTPEGSVRAIPRRTLALSTPGAASTSMVS